VWGPGVAIDPRVPKKRTRIAPSLLYSLLHPNVSFGVNFGTGEGRCRTAALDPLLSLVGPTGNGRVVWIRRRVRVGLGGHDGRVGRRGRTEQERHLFIRISERSA
jgi:hypothetical protein